MDCLINDRVRRCLHLRCLHFRYSRYSHRYRAIGSSSRHATLQPIAEIVCTDTILSALTTIPGDIILLVGELVHCCVRHCFAGLE